MASETLTTKDSCNEFFEQRQIGRDTIDAFGLEVVDETIRIPIYDRDGQLEGHLSRTQQGYRAEQGLRLGGLYNEQVLARAEGRLWVVEGVADVWALHAAGVESAVALMGGYTKSASRRKLERVAAFCVSHDLELVLWAGYDFPGEDSDYLELAPLLEQVHRLHRVKTAVYTANLAEEGEGSPARVISANDRTLVAAALAGGPQLDGTTVQILGTVKTLRKASLPLRIRAVQDALQRAPQRPDLERLSSLLRYEDPELWFALDALPDNLAGWLKSGLPESAGGTLEPEMRAWTEQHGSPALKHALARGYDTLPMYLNERAGKELPDGTYVDALPRAERLLSVGARNHPTRTALELELALIEQGLDPDKLRVRWITLAPTDCPTGEVVEVTGYLDRYLAYVPVPLTPPWSSRP